MSSMKPWMEGIGDIDLDVRPHEELSPELLRAVRRRTRESRGRSSILS